ncbi:DUF503 domain-containing protein [Salipaludibacillus agaradhaerens]|uniref:DUF503 domain-containing protein n=1 Tax=Salipaludibacillus agaradhaerens TaxID=76935 RepID=A0A9Q4B136_SALAG|nr:DUF503 domain-containing protein [Salipaludibacillus agaradhaerens]UJW58108.1 DUF503 domain-containing protein [Bacillus sp. A116_S68]MCR6096087.1 DUF503 domain-containing protein [Salipaludibacillus agaradhaerens]MCR6107025.1 DUF503 domain-containing protein [Salipaludibacillus agaradhaerens]MCR6114354.1 DUF503 domain-containing protein [Salipaludibacillus agaradhaerens]MCR6119056.1 DUF503 domain-containing protein [Salipaludibacillus agaradhaerens]
MIIGVLVVEAVIYDSGSLKEKRSVLKSASTKIKQRFNVSIAETNHQNVWQRTEWAIVSVSSEKVQVEKELQKSLKLLESYTELEISNVSWEWL